MKFKVGHIPRKAGVYQCTTPSGSYYIGRAADMKERVYQHHAKLKQGKHANERLQRSYDKYGGRLKWSVLFLADTVQTAIHWEGNYLQMFWGDTKLMNMRKGDGFTAEENERNKRKPVFAMNVWTGHYIRLAYVSEMASILEKHRNWKIPKCVYGVSVHDCSNARNKYLQKDMKRSANVYAKQADYKPKRGYHVRNIHTGYVGYVHTVDQLKKIGAWYSLYSKTNSFFNGWQVRKVGESWSWNVPISHKIAVYGLHVTGDVNTWVSRSECERDIGRGANMVFTGNLVTYKGWRLFSKPVPCLKNDR